MRIFSDAFFSASDKKTFSNTQFNCLQLKGTLLEVEGGGRKQAYCLFFDVGTQAPSAECQQPEHGQPAPTNI